MAMKGNALAHLIKYYSGIESAQTQTSYSERELMNKYVIKSNNLVEIGVFEGFNTREFALNAPDNACIYAIDPFFKGFFGFNYGKRIAELEWKKYKIRHKIKLIEGFSWDVVDQLPTNSLDFIFIDGDHSFEGVKKDFNLYSPLLSPTGVIALHDARVFENGWTKADWGPVRLVEEIIKPSTQWEILDEIDSLVIIRNRLR